MKGETMRAGGWSAWVSALALCGFSGALFAASVQTFSPQGEAARVRQARATFSESMVRFGDPRLPAPFEPRCTNTTPVTGTGRWVDDKSWVYDFTQDVPAGVRCELTPKPGLKSIAGQPFAEPPSFKLT